MKLNEHERAGPNIAGLASAVQRAEMKIILAGKWPALKPLPVFKYETEEYRAAIDFDKLRGEWVCRKTSFPSNKIQELRGGLAEITRALPHAPGEAFTEDAAEEHPEQELENDAQRRLQATQEWREHYESGALYSELREYLSESQREEIDESIRLTLTARQLQFNARNVAYVFDALSKAGGKLASLIEIAQRNRAGRGALSAGQAEVLAVGAEAERNAQVESVVPPTIEDLSTESVGNVLPGQQQTCSEELIERAAAAAKESEAATPVIQGAIRVSHVEDFREKVHLPVGDFAPRVRAGRVERSTEWIENSSSHIPILKISGFQVAAFALMCLFAVISFTVGLTVGREPVGKSISDVQKSKVAVDAASSTLAIRPEETTSRTSIPLVGNTVHEPAVNPRADSATGVNPSSSTALIARSATPPASPKSAYASKAFGLKSEATRDSTPRMGTPAMDQTRHTSRSSTVLVTGPGDGGKPFTLTLPEKSIAASPTFAMTSQLSVLVSPEPGHALAHRASRLQAGELVSFVWPRYPRAGQRNGSAEIVKVRANIGKFGQVQDIKLMSGSTSLFPAATNAIRQWRYTPTLLNKTPVQAQVEVTIEFRPPEYLSRVRTKNPLHN